MAGSASFGGPDSGSEPSIPFPGYVPFTTRSRIRLGMGGAYGDPIPEAGLEEALGRVRFPEGKYRERGGLYDWFK